MMKPPPPTQDGKEPKFYGFTIPYGFQLSLKRTKKNGWTLYGGNRISAVFGDDFAAGYTELKNRLKSTPAVMYV